MAVSAEDDDNQSKDNSDPAEGECPSTNSAIVLKFVHVGFIVILRGNDNPKDDRNDEDNDQNKEEEGSYTPAVHCLKFMFNLLYRTEKKNFFLKNQDLIQIEKI